MANPHQQPAMPPGWYPTPTGQQYFDGYQWVTTPTPVAVTGIEPGRSTVNYGFVVLAVFSLLGTLIPCIGLISTGMEVDPTTGQASGAGVTMGVLWGLWGGMWTIIWAAFAFSRTLKSRR